MAGTRAAQSLRCDAVDLAILPMDFGVFWGVTNLRVA
jgi:hypothetical protein